MIAIPNIDKPKTCDGCDLVQYWVDGSLYCMADGKELNIEADIRNDCPIIEIPDEIWEALKPKIETMSMALKGWVDDSNADQRTQCVESVKEDEKEEWLDYREEQEFEDRWERRADEHTD